MKFYLPNIVHFSFLFLLCFKFYLPNIVHFPSPSFCVLIFTYQILSISLSSSSAYEFYLQIIVHFSHIISFLCVIYGENFSCHFHSSPSLTKKISPLLRNMIKPEVVKPPLIPIYPMVSKDLSVIHICNKTKLEGLINFEKMRFVAKVNFFYKLNPIL